MRCAVISRTHLPSVARRAEVQFYISGRWVRLYRAHRQSPFILLGVESLRGGPGLLYPKVIAPRHVNTPGKDNRYAS